MSENNFGGLMNYEQFRCERRTKILLTLISVVPMHSFLRLVRIAVCLDDELATYEGEDGRRGAKRVSNFTETGTE